MLLSALSCEEGAPGVISVLLKTCFRNANTPNTVVSAQYNIKME
jgi:hypothetical protein